MTNTQRHILIVYIFDGQDTNYDWRTTTNRYLTKSTHALTHTHNQMFAVFQKSAKLNKSSKQLTHFSIFFDKDFEQQAFDCALIFFLQVKTQKNKIVTVKTTLTEWGDKQIYPSNIKNSFSFV